MVSKKRQDSLICPGLDKVLLQLVEIQPVRVRDVALLLNVGQCLGHGLEQLVARLGDVNQEANDRKGAICNGSASSPTSQFHMSSPVGLHPAPDGIISRRKDKLPTRFKNQNKI